MSTALAASLSFTVPLPPPSLRSNSRAHWARKMRDKKAYSEQVWVAWQGGGPFVTLEKAHVLYVWKHAGVAPDVSNLGANTKALQDFLCCAPDNGLQRNDCYYLGLIRDDRGITPMYRALKVDRRADEGVEIVIARDEREPEPQDRGDRLPQGIAERSRPPGAARAVAGMHPPERELDRDEHRFCAQDWHRCDGGGKGEYDRYVTPEPRRG